MATKRVDLSRNYDWPIPNAPAGSSVAYKKGQGVLMKEEHAEAAVKAGVGTVVGDAPKAAEPKAKP